MGTNRSNARQGLSGKAGTGFNLWLPFIVSIDVSGMLLQ